MPTTKDVVDDPKAQETIGFIAHLIVEQAEENIDAGKVTEVPAV